jgi:hypothetical protein
MRGDGWLVLLIEEDENGYLEKKTGGNQRVIGPPVFTYMGRISVVYLG